MECELNFVRGSMLTIERAEKKWYIIVAGISYYEMAEHDDKPSWLFSLSFEFMLGYWGQAEQFW